ncbi:phytanoyl-CoA dioxygenase family protein [Roseibium aggregatum]|uniref:phytanoyl-CoA dioxygenase family protein n=1 Tax=Roseibium aggregatum TaxID=187304 RepID=UPI0025AD8FA9|nr:phytanoyl-CoA dioxygenase family protein [Roseibium aggregatum]WJS05553.1 phytanoyl-CoA dioxygenase family protein [Roseibium aggregatum]
MHDTSDFIRSQGYAVVENFVSPETCDRLRKAVLRLHSEDNDNYGKKFLYDIGQEGFVINIGDRDPAFQELLNDFPAAGVVEDLLDGEAALYLFQGVIVPPGGGIGAYPWKWHCDLFHVTKMLGGEEFIPGVNVLLFVDHVDDRNGGTWLAPGSQGMDESQIAIGDTAYQKEGEFQLVAPKGAAVFFNPLMWHCAGANHTDQPRCAVKMLCVRDWMLPQMDYAQSISDEVLQGYNDRAKKLLGHGPAIIRRSFDHDPEHKTSGVAAE